MPINRLVCQACEYEEEYITRTSQEEIPSQLCKKCGSTLVRGIGRINYFNTLTTGYWEMGPDGQEHYKGKGGPAVPISNLDGNPIS